MPASPSRVAPGFSRRTLLAASAGGLALVVAACTSGAGDPVAGDDGERLQADALADALAVQVGVQEALVAAYAAAAAADPALGTGTTELAAQAAEQLDRLRAAAPSATSSASAPSPPAAPDARTWLREQVGAAATAHAAAAVDQTGAGAALLGSIAAGLRGQQGRLA